MSKRKNIWKRYPNTIQLLEEEIYGRRKRARSMSQYALAEKTGTTRNCIQQLECHEHMPKPETVFKLIRALGFDEAEREGFLMKYTMALYKDSELQEEQEKELAGAL